MVGAPGVIVGSRDANDSRDIAQDRPHDDDTLGDAWREADVTDRDYDDLRYTLSVKVRDEDYDQIVHDLRANNAYVERFD